MMKRAAGILPRNGPVWARICYKYVLQNEFQVGEMAYNLFKFDPEARVVQLQISLKPFCSIKDIRVKYFIFVKIV